MWWVAIVGTVSFLRAASLQTTLDMTNTDHEAGPCLTVNETTVVTRFALDLILRMIRRYAAIPGQCGAVEIVASSKGEAGFANNCIRNRKNVKVKRQFLFSHQTIA